MSLGIQAYAAYVPRYRVAASDVGGRRDRVAASFDEDSTTMAVAAGSSALGGAPGVSLSAVLLATSSPAYADKTNATTIAAALHLPSEALAADLVGTARSVFAGLRTGGPTLLVAADVRVGRSGSADERLGGDGAAAVLVGEGDGVAAIRATASLTDEFLDRWRDPASPAGVQWEERFGFERYADLIRRASQRALDAAGVVQADHVVVTSPNSSVARQAARLVKGTVQTVGSPLGFSGAADPLLGLAAVLDVAAPGETILLASAVDGCDALVLETTPLLAERRQPVPLVDQLSDGLPVPYTTYLSWRGLLERELPRRPEPDRPAGPPSARSAGWKFGLTGSRCTRCTLVHLPPARVCRECGATDAMEGVPVAGLQGRVATFTVDRLAYSPSPPVVDVVVDVDGGGRCSLEVADADPDAVTIGARVAFTFRSLFTAGGVHNYFWKARVVPEQSSTEGATA